MVGLGLSFKNSGLDLDHKTLQSAHLWHWQTSVRKLIREIPEN